jgi:hypothetical protein
MSIKKLSGGTYVVGGEAEASLVELSAHTSSGNTGKSSKDKYWAKWFNTNDHLDRDKEPQILLDLAKHNNLQMPLIGTNVDFCIGSGVGFFKQEITNGKKSLIPAEFPDVQKWFEENEVNEVMTKLASDFYYTGNYFLEGRLSGERKVYSVKHQHPTDCRAGLIDRETGKTEYFYVGDFKSGKAKYDPEHPKDQKKSTVTRVRAFVQKYPAAKFLWHGKQYFPGEKYYGIPLHFGVKNWVKLANQIPIFHLSGLTKGYNIRWHIKIPVSYFEQFPENEREAEEESIMRELDMLLSGAENHGKAFVSRFSNEKNYPEWKIEALKGELYDEAYKDIFQHSNTALSSANNIDPSLAGYDITGKLSSGSEKRNSYLIHIALKTPRPRQILLKWLYDVKRINGWPPELIFAFKDIEITTLDKNPTGTQNTVAS